MSSITATQSAPSLLAMIMLAITNCLLYRLDSNGLVEIDESKRKMREAMEMFRSVSQSEPGLIINQDHAQVKNS